MFVRKKKIPKFKLKPHFKYKIKFYNILFDNRKDIMKEISNYIKLRLLLGRGLRARYSLPHNFKYIFNKKRLEGTLKIPGWKKRTWDFNFFSPKTFNDDWLYNLWNMKPSYLKYVYSKINRMHPYRQIYKLAYRTLLIFPYSITIKPFTIIFKNYYLGNFFLIFEWTSKWNHSHILIKIIDKKGRHIPRDLNPSIFSLPRKPSNEPPENIFYKFFYLRLLKSLYYTPLNSLLVLTQKYTSKLAVILSRKKIKLLLWHRENWLWRLRANWKFMKLHKYIYTKRFKNILLDLFKIKFMDLEYYDFFPIEIFIEKFTEIFIRELKVFKLVNLAKKYKISRFKYVNSYGEKNLYFKSRNNFFKKYSFNKTSFFSRLYYLYFFWILYFLKNIYQYINKISFSLWFRFFYFTANLSNESNLSRFFSLDLLAYHRISSFDFKLNNELLFISNLDKFLSYFMLFNKVSKLRLNNYNFYKSSYFYYMKNLLINRKITSNFFINFKNFINFNYSSVSNYYLRNQRKSYNSFFISILDYFEINNYTFFTNFRTNYLQTFRFITDTPRGVLKNLKDNDNRINYDKIYYFLNSINKDELQYSNFELGLPEDKRMYFL